MIRYSSEFQFKEGIYITIEQLKHNKPLKQAKIISDLDPNDFDYFDELLENKTISFYDDDNTIRKENTSSIWGYCRGSSIFVNYNSQFNRIPVFGNVCHFVSDKTVFHERMTDPYYNQYYYPVNQSYETTEIQQYILDIETGKIMEYNWQNVETILMRDSELFDEFNKLPKRKKKNLLFLYIRKYNERNPLYLYK